MNEPMNCRICHNTFQNRDECEPTDICDICAQTELAGAMEKVKKLNDIITNLDYRLGVSQRACDGANKLLREALTEANQWRNHVMRCRQMETYGQENRMCIEIQVGTFYHLAQLDREQLVKEQLLSAMIQLFRQISPETAVLEVLQKRKEKV